MIDRLFYVGRLGWLRSLPDVESPADTPPSRIGGSGQSLYGRQWRDTLSYLDSWTWKWNNLLAPQTVYVDALLHGQVRGPLRLLDPRKVNRVPRQQASGGSVSGSSEGFGVSAGGLQYRDLLKASPSVDTLPMGDSIRGCQEWVRPNAGSGALYLAGPELDGTWRAPLLPGEQVRLSMWVGGADGLAPELRWIEYERDDTPHSYYSTQQASDTVALASGVWQEVSLLVTGKVASGTGTFTSASITPRLYLPEGSPAGSVFVTGIQVRSVESELPHGIHGACVPDPPPGLWYPGGASPRVVVDPGPAAHADVGWYDAGLTLTETTTV